LYRAFFLPVLFSVPDVNTFYINKPKTSFSDTLYYRGADKSLDEPISQRILFDSENISFDGSLVIYINSTNIPLIMIINRIYENQNLLSL